MRKRLKIVNPDKLEGWQINPDWVVWRVIETPVEWVFTVNNDKKSWMQNIFLDKFSREDGRWWFNRRGSNKSLVGFDIGFFSTPGRMINRLENEMRSQNIIS